MNRWEKVLALEGANTKLFSYYKFPFTTDVRHVIAPWIEETFQGLYYLDPIYRDHCPQIEGIMTNMVRELNAKSCDPHIIMTDEFRESITNSARNIDGHFSTIGWSLFDNIRYCIQLESDFLNEPELEFCEPEEFTWDVFENLKTCHDELILQHTKLNGQNYGNIGISTQFEFQLQISNYSKLLEDFGNEFEGHFSKMSFELTVRTTFRLDKWKEERKMFLQGKLKPPFTIELDALQEYYEYYANHLWCLLDLVKRVGQLIEQLPADLIGFLGPQHMANVHAMQSKVESKLKKLVSESFVVKTQPSQLIVKDTTVGEPVVQLLIGKQVRTRSNIEVTCQILDAVQALQYANAKYDVNNPVTLPPPDKTCVKLKNNSVRLTTDDCTANFKKTMLTGKIDRLKSKKEYPQYANTPYYDENNWLYFYGTFEFGGIRFTLQEFSDPIKLMTNSDQKGVCMGTLLFDIAAGRFGVESVLQRPGQIFWHDFESAFQAWVTGMTGRHLDPTEFYTIKKMLLKSDYFDKITRNSMTEELSLKILRDKCHGKKPDDFSFAEWIYSMTVFIKKHLGPQTREIANQIVMRPGLWESRVFRNVFMDSSTAGRNLPKIKGAFLMRFSYNVEDAITIDFVANRTAYSHRCTSDELKDGSLIDLIRDVPVWENLHVGNPNNPEIIRRQDLLEKYSIPRDPTANVKVPYIKSLTEILDQFSALTVSSSPSPSTSLIRNSPTVY